jgi:hypothetical protein
MWAENMENSGDLSEKMKSASHLGKAFFGVI